MLTLAKIELKILWVILLKILSSENFLKMYAEQYVSDNENSSIVKNFELKYITNISDNRKVISINFEEDVNVYIILFNADSSRA